jgi:hypothetical protein
MKELRSEDLAQLVSVGGWVRGTDALTALVLQNYKPESAALLRQDALVDQLASQLGQMSGDLREQPLVRRISAGVEQVREVLAAPGTEISAEQAKELAHIAAEVLKAIVTRA